MINCVRIESNFGDGMFAKLLTPYLTRIAGGVTIDEKRNSAQKELRIIETLEPVMMQNRLIVDPRIIERDLEKNVHDMSYSLFYQMARITNERGALKHDDQLDCLELAVDYWLEQMDADSERLESERQEEAMDQWLAEYDDLYEGQQADSWIEAW